MGKDDIISNFLRTMQPTKRTCTICGDEYVGIKAICEKRQCYWALQARVQENRSLRPRDYQSKGRKTFLVLDGPPPDEKKH
jgi:hypothetical protein